MISQYQKQIIHDEIMSTWGTLFSLLDYLSIRDHNTVSLSHDLKF